MPKFFEISPLSGAEKHHNFQVTLCYQKDTTNVGFGYIETRLTKVKSRKIMP